jgi:hypothetical protein
MPPARTFLLAGTLFVGLATALSIRPPTQAHQAQFANVRPAATGTNPAGPVAASTAVAVVNAAFVSTVEARIADANRRVQDAQATAEALERQETARNRRAFLVYVVFLLVVCLNVALAIAYASVEKISLPIVGDVYGKAGLVLIALFAIQMTLVLGYAYRQWVGEEARQATEAGTPTRQASPSVRDSSPP